MDIAVGSASGGPLAQGAEECRCPPGRYFEHHNNDDDYPQDDIMMMLMIIIMLMTELRNVTDMTNISV